MSAEGMLHRVRTALGRSVGQPPDEAPAVRLRVPEVPLEDRIADFFRNLEALSGNTFQADSPAAAREYIAQLIEGRTAIASNSPFLRECGVTDLPSIQKDFSGQEELRAACAQVDFGVTSADYALADTGTLVMFSSPQEARMISLLPPVHICVIPRDRVLTGLDELFALEPLPAEKSSSMVLITGPSRTADIEQLLVRGIHGPGEVYAIVV